MDEQRGGRWEAAASELDELYARYAQLTIANEELSAQLWRYQASWMVARALQVSKLLRSGLPPGSRRRRAASTAARVLLGRPGAEERFKERYHAWLAARRPDAEELERQRKRASGWVQRPLVSVCMPVFNPSPDALREAIGSVRAQSYDGWELCICDDASTRPGVRQVLEELSGTDPRVRVTYAEENGGISAATNRALALARGEYVGFLDDDDMIEPHTLYLYVQALQDDAGIDVFYCDEDILMPSGERLRPFFKPSWSPETLLGMNYVTHFVVARRRLVEEVGGLRAERDGAQDYDLLLRLTERTQAVHHVPEVLYTWRQSPTSASMSAKAKPWAYQAGRHAVEDALARRHIEGRVESGGFAGGYRVRYRLPEPPPHVEIVIPTRDRADLLGPCLESISSLTSYGDYSVTVLDNDSREEATRDLLRRAGVRVVAAPGPFNYAAIVNRGFASTDADFVLTLNNDTRVLEPDWLGGLMELGFRPGVGAVGCRLVLADGRPQHQGIVIACGVPAANLGHLAPGIRVLGDVQTVRDVSAVTGACSLIRRSAWEEVGGLDEELAVAYNDVDFCLRLGRAGYRVLYTPYVTLVHEESASRGEVHPAEDEARLLRRWAAEMAQGDPFFTPHLTLGRDGLEIDVEGRSFRGKDLVQLQLRWRAGAPPS
jgi:GT2 family glycosyltransferase